MIKNQIKSNLLEIKRDQKRQDKKTRLLIRKINQLNKRRKNIWEQMRFSWQWCRLNKNHQRKKNKIEIRKAKRDHKLLNKVEDEVNEAEVVDVAKEAIEEVWKLINETINTLVKKIGRQNRHLNQNKKVHHLTTSSIQLPRIRSLKTKNLKLN
jgi:hypothetical protein